MVTQISDFTGIVFYIKLKPLKVFHRSKYLVPIFHIFHGAPDKCWDDVARLEEVVSEVDEMLLGAEHFSDRCHFGMFLDIRVAEQLRSELLTLRDEQEPEDD